MIYCERCDTANRDGSRFCNACGYPLEEAGRRPCPSCSYVNPVEGKFCGNCGAALVAPPPPSAEEAGPEELPFTQEELSAWLEAGEESVTAPSPVQPPPEPSLAEAKEEATPLAGIGDVIPIGPPFALPRSSIPREGAFLPGLEAEQARILADIVAAQPTEERGLRRWDGIFRRVTYAALALATLLPLLWGVSLWDQDIPIRPPTEAFYEAVEDVPQGKLVLVSFDYEPGMAMELDSQAQAIIDHLMGRGLRIAAMSLLPQGPALAQQMLEEGAGRNDGYQYGRDYLNLGYLPGGEVGLRVWVEKPWEAFRRDYRDAIPLTNFAMAQELAEIGNIALVIDLAGSQEMPRMWLEQVGSHREVPIVAGVTGAAEQGMRPYLESGQLRGLLSGLVGAAEYEQVTQGQGRARGTMGAQSAAHLTILLFVVVGNLAYLATKARAKG